MAKALKIAGAVVAVAGLAIITGGLAAGASLSFIMSAGFGVGTLTVGGLMAVGAALNTAGSLLSPKPKAPATSEANANRLTVSMDLRAFRKTVIGSTAFATDLRDQEWSADQSVLHRFIVCASHRVQAIREIWFDDKLAWTATGGVQAPYVGYLDVTPVLEGSAANAINIGPRMGASRRFTGCAYVYFRYKLTGNGKKAESPFASSIPSRVTIVGDGAYFYDPRLDSTVPGGSGPMRADDQRTWAWNPAFCRNPALGLLFYLLGWRIQNPATGEWKLAIGKGIPASRIDLPSFITAANLCEEPVTRADGTVEPRYRADGIYSEGDDPSLVLDNLKAAMNAVLDDADGKIRVTVLHNDLASPIGDLTTADVLGEFTWLQTPPLTDSVNVIRGGYIDPSPTSLYQLVDLPEVSIPSPDGIDRPQTVNLALVQSPGQGQRLFKLRLGRAQYGGTYTAVFQATAWKYQKGDVIRFTFLPLGWDKKLFRIADVATQVDGTVPMMLREEHPAIYAAYSDERAAITAAAPTSYDPTLWPVIQGIVDAGTTAEWSGVAGPGKPADNATVGAPAGTRVGDVPVEIVIHQIEQIDPIKTDVSALRQVTIEHDAALSALGQVDEAQAAALEKLKGDTGQSLAVLDAAGVRRDAAQRDADEALGRISEATLRALMEADRTRAVLRDAGIVVDPATGVVRIHAIDQVADRTSAVEVKLDAQASTIRSKASVDFVQEQIALAVLDPSQVAELEPLIRRMTSAETVLDGLRATVALKADALELTRTVARLTSVGQTLDALAGTVDTKASRAALDAQGLRLTDAEQRIAALPNGASITVTLRQVGAAADAAGEAALRGMVAGDEAGRARIREIAEYREEAITRIDTGLAAESLARRALATSMGTLDARLTDQVRSLVTTTTATAERVNALAVSSGAQAAAIGGLEEAAINAAGGIARAERTIRQVAGVADANAEATLRALIAGDAAALAAQAQLAQVHEETTTRLIVGERSAAQTKLLLEAQLGAARALIGQTADTLATADRAAASRMDAIDVRVGAVSDDVAATQARITREVEALASADAAQVRQIDAVALEMRDPGTGLVATRAMAIADAQASVERDKAQVRRIDAIGVVAADAAAGIAEAREVSAEQGRGMTKLSTALRQTAGQADDGAEAVLRALVAGDDASRAGQRQIVQIQTELSTQLVANEQASAIARQALAARMGRAEGAIVDLTKVVSTLDAATAQRLTALEVAFAAQGREIIATVARIAREEEARAAGDHAEALARQTLEARVDGVAGDVGDVRAAIGDEARVRAAADDAEASARQTLQAEVGGIAKDVTAVAASIGDEARVRAEADQAEAEARRVLAAQVNDPNTGLAAAMAQIGAVDRARVSGDEASAEMVRQVRAYLDGIGSVGLQQAFEALVTRTGKLEGRYTLAIDTNGRWQGFVLAGSQNGPASFSLIDTDFLMGNGKIVFNTGTYMKVQGVGFGAAKDLIEWYGPTMAIDKCSRANALEYRTTTGDAYYGGSLSAGTLRNPGQSSSLAADAVAEVTPFGSNGKPVRYIASWSYYSQYERTFSADAQGVKLFEQAVEASGATSDDGGYYYYGLKNIERPASTITLTRAFAGAASQQLDQRSFTTEQTTFRGLKPTPGDAPGRATYTETIGGGFTVTDPVQSTADRALKLTLSRGLTFSEGVIQRLSIIAVEE